jgi:hypothetical protein
MSVSDYAAWWGAVIATIVLAWDIIKWRSRGPRLRTLISRRDSQELEFRVFVSNTGDQAATIESVMLKCFERRLWIFRKRMDLHHVFSLSGSNGFPPLTLQPGEPWEVFISPCRQIPKLPPRERLILVIEIQESHRSRPYRYYPDLARTTAE